MHYAYLHTIFVFLLFCIIRYSLERILIFVPLDLLTFKNYLHNNIFHLLNQFLVILQQQTSSQGLKPVRIRGFWYLEKFHISHLKHLVFLTSVETFQWTNPLLLGNCGRLLYHNGLGASIYICLITFLNVIHSSLISGDVPPRVSLGNVN